MSISKVKSTNPGGSQPLNGPFDSQEHNRQMDLIRRDQAEITDRLNIIIDILNALPMEGEGGGRDARNGLDGDTIYMDKDAKYDETSASMRRYLLNESQEGSNPATVQTTILRIIDDIVQQSRSITSSIQQVTHGTVNPTPNVDVASINNNLRRLYNTVFKDGSALMTGSPDAIFTKSIQESTLEGASSLDTRVASLEGTIGSISGAQTNLDKSDTVNDNKNLSVAPLHLQDEMNELRTLINLNIGTDGNFKVPVLRTLSDPSLHQHTGFIGTGTQTTKNPHALEVQTKWDDGEIALSSDLDALSDDFDMMFRALPSTKKTWRNSAGEITLIRIYSSVVEYGEGGDIIYEEAREYYTTGTWTGFLSKVTIVWDSITWVTDITYTGDPAAAYTSTEVTTQSTP